MMALVAWVILHEFAHGLRWREELVDESYERGAVVIAALEEYKQDHTVYPPRLEDLIPEYLEEVPLPAAGNKEWCYDLFRDGSFQLAVEDCPGGFPVHFYLSDHGQWACDTG